MRAYGAYETPYAVSLDVKLRDIVAGSLDSGSLLLAIICLISVVVHFCAYTAADDHLYGLWWPGVNGLWHSEQ